MIDARHISSYNKRMNKMPTKTRAAILSLLCESMSMRAVARTTDVSFNTVKKILIDAGEACAAYHDEHVRNVLAKRVQCDEIWSFVYAKDKNVPDAVSAPEDAGDVWTWTAIDADSRLLISYLVGGRDSGYAKEFMEDVASRLTNRVQLTTDGHRSYLEAVEGAFGCDVDYAMLIKIYGKSKAKDDEIRYSPAECMGTKVQVVSGDPDKDHISTSYVERQNLTMRMHMRRFTRLTNGFSKKFENHAHMVAIYTVFYNFCKIHKTLRVTPAMETGLSDTVRNAEWIVGLMDARKPLPKKRRGPYKKKAA